MNTYGRRAFERSEFPQGLRTRDDSLVKERRRRAGRRESKEQYTPEQLCCQEQHIYLFANSNELWKFVRTERKSKPKTRALETELLGTLRVSVSCERENYCPAIVIGTAEHSFVEERK